MNLKIREIVIVMVVILILTTGCMSSDYSHGTTTISPAPSTQIPNTGYWIKIDPIPDFSLSSSSNGTKSSKLTISGTTNHPSGSGLYSEIIQYSGEKTLWTTTLEVKSNDSGSNTFSYQYNIGGGIPGRYQISVSNADNRKAISRFDLLSDHGRINTSYSWIDAEPFSEMQSGNNFFLSGATNLPAGTEIAIGYYVIAHTCYPPPTPDKPGSRTYCGGGCKYGEGANYTVHTLAGDRGINSWNLTINTTGFCAAAYNLEIHAGNGTDTTHVPKTFGFAPG